MIPLYLLNEFVTPPPQKNDVALRSSRNLLMISPKDLTEYSQDTVTVAIDVR